jgi:hypothetical protein
LTPELVGVRAVVEAGSGVDAMILAAGPLAGVRLRHDFEGEVLSEIRF